MTQRATLRKIPVEEYLAGETRSEIRHEYVAGEVFAMVGATRAHNLIAGNIFAFLHRHLRGTPCDVYMSDMKVRIEAADAFYYPDVAVSCEKLPPDALYLEAPILIVEVLSPSTENIDRREKRLNYARLPSLREYLLVATDERRVELYRYDENPPRWELYRPEDREIFLRSVETRLSLAEIYRGVL